jgi:hypothetical protein
MRMSSSTFRDWREKAVTLFGMSGVGKTRLASLLRRHHWFHYSADYRIGKRYLDEPILDNIKSQAMQVPFLRELLRNDSIQIYNNLSFDNLSPVSSFLGKVGNPELGGLSLPEFNRRQQLHHDAEVSALLDVPQFIVKAHEIYGYACFVNDAGGSACEIEVPGVIETLAEHTLMLYIEATPRDEISLIQRAEQSPKPLYYRPEFLAEALGQYLEEQGLEYVALMDPDDFVRWVFPRLYRSRIPRYADIVRRHGYTVTSEEVAQVATEADFIELVARAIERAEAAAA